MTKLPSAFLGNFSNLGGGGGGGGVEGLMEGKDGFEKNEASSPSCQQSPSSPSCQPSPSPPVRPPKPHPGQKVGFGNSKQGEKE